MGKIKMGFLGAGDMAETMAQTVVQMPELEPWAVAARDGGRAEAFREKYGFARSYDSYEALAADPEVELVYIATPHSHHARQAIMCMEAGKGVLCEKAFTGNARQAEEVLAYSAAHKVFITEAIWTRYMPFSRTINEVLASGVIGKPTLLTANLGYVISHVPRIQDPALAGGALLDLSVYPINFASMIFGGEIEELSTACTFTPSGVDGMDSITLRFEGGEMAVLTSSMYSRMDRKGIVYGDKGYIVVDNINNPEGLHVMNLDWEEVAAYRAPTQISGYEYELLACVKALREGHIECPEMPHGETLRIMKLMDEIRGNWGLRFPFD